MASYRVRFNKSMDGVNFNQITNIKKFLQAEITTDYDDKDDVWLVTTDKKLTLSLMNTALAKAGITNRNTVSIEEEEDSSSSSDSER